ncbi:MAG: BlaI/MecI/CopY family transcriptional regulator [Cytophagales bacterium]|nr:BlaI/MecI/CopY family transcriptional regulator [Armatimonadota bacterium]
MGRKASVGRAESEVLRYVADRHPVTVRETADHFAEARGLAKTTILNVMERLREKGFLTREPGEGGFRYSPSQPKGRLMRDLVRDFVDEMLGGSLEPFTAYLADNPKINDAELARLKEVIAQMEEKEASHE